jgi:regulator of sirC expression with transglutaminase-like and TPR domain
MSTAASDIKRDLAELAGQPDESIDLAEAALALAAVEHPLRARAPYRALLTEMVAELAARAGQAVSAEARAYALGETLAGDWDLTGDDRDEEDPGSANLMEVLDHRRGLPLALGILWLHAGRAQGWTMEPLAFPDTCLIRLTDDDGRRVILDPFNHGRLLDAAMMRDQLKATAGITAELEPAHYTALSNREVLLRLETSVKLCHLRLSHLRQAAEIVEAILLFAPDEIALWREAGLLHLRLGNAPAAIAALEQYIARAPNSTARHRTSVLLQELRDRLTSF